MHVSIEFLHEYLSGMSLRVHKCSQRRTSPTWGQEQVVFEHNRFYHILEGECTVQIGGEEFHPRAGHLLLYPSGTPISYRRTGEQLVLRQLCDFTATVGNRQLFDLLRVRPAAQFEASAGMHSKFNQLEEALSDRRVGSIFRVQSIFLEILWSFLQASEIRDIRLEEAVSFERMSALLQYIDDRLHDRISTEELAALMHYHPNYFYQVFKKLTGTTPNSYIHSRRMERAKQLLLTTQRPVKEIADSVGIEFHYFSAQFKRYAGCSASDYRRKLDAE